MKSAISEDLRKEIIDLKIRANVIGYKNIFPRLPKEQPTQKAFDNLMIGFEKRLQNWKNGLLQLENPGGMLNGKKRGENENLSVEPIIYRHNVMHSMQELQILTEEE